MSFIVMWKNDISEKPWFKKKKNSYYYEIIITTDVWMCEQLVYVVAGLVGVNFDYFSYCWEYTTMYHFVKALIDFYKKKS